MPLFCDGGAFDVIHSTGNGPVGAASPVFSVTKQAAVVSDSRLLCRIWAVQSRGCGCHYISASLKGISGVLSFRLAGKLRLTGNQENFGRNFPLNPEEVYAILT